MARTRGASIHPPSTSRQEEETRVNSSVHGDVRRTPTTSTYRSRGHHVTREAAALLDPPVEQHEDVTQQHEDVVDHQQGNEEVGFPRGPSDISF